MVPRRPSPEIGHRDYYLLLLRPNVVYKSFNEEVTKIRNKNAKIYSELKVV